MKEQRHPLNWGDKGGCTVAPRAQQLRGGTRGTGTWEGSGSGGGELEGSLCIIEHRLARRWLHRIKRQAADQLQWSALPRPAVCRRGADIEVRLSMVHPATIHTLPFSSPSWHTPQDGGPLNPFPPTCFLLNWLPSLHFIFPHTLSLSSHPTVSTVCSDTR